MIQQELIDNNQSTTLRLTAPMIAVNPYPNDIKHIFIISSFENKDYSSVVAQAPYMMSLANKGALFTNFLSLGHPSQPNYFRAFAGISIVSDNNDPGFQSRSELNLYTQMKSIGKTFEEYSEGLPSIGYAGFQTGTYYGKHDAPRAFKNVDQTVRKPWNQLPTNLNTCATIVYLNPDINNSGHDTNIPYADNWYKNNTNIQRVVNFVKDSTNKSILINTWDEGSATNQIFVSMYGYKVISGVKISKALNQYDLVNMLLDMNGAARINTAASRTQVMDGWFTTAVDTTVVLGCATNFSPANNSISVPVVSTLSWSPTTGNPTGYDVFIGTTNQPSGLVSSNQSATTYKPTSLLVNTTYFWKIVPRTASTQVSTCPVNQFTTINNVIPTDTCTTPKDTTIKVLRDSTYKKQIITYKDTTIKVLKDSTYVIRIPSPCANPIDTNTIQTYRATYISKYNQIVGNKLLENALIRDCIAKRFNSLHCYGASSSNYSAMASLNTRLRIEGGVKEIVAVTQGAPEAFGWVKTYNSVTPDAGDFDAVNFEYEPWNGGVNMPTMWATNKSWLNQVHTGLTTIPLDHNYDYFGWWSASPMTLEAPSTLVATTSIVLLHDYRLQPEFAYMRGRLNDINKAAIAQNKIVDIVVIFSSEPAFMQTWLKTHTLDQALAIIKTGFDAQNYTNLKLKGWLNFHLDFLRVAQPTPPVTTPAALSVTPTPQFRAPGVPQYSSPGFRNVTTAKSKRMAQQRQ